MVGDFARMNRPAFEEAARDLVGRLAILRGLAAGEGAS